MHLLLYYQSSSDFLPNQLVQKNIFRNPIRVSNGLGPGLDRHSVGPDLGPNCLQRLSVDDKLKYSHVQKTCPKRQLKKNTKKKIFFYIYKLSPNAGQKYCRMLLLQYFRPS